MHVPPEQTNYRIHLRGNAFFYFERSSVFLFLKSQPMLSDATNKTVCGNIFWLNVATFKSTFTQPDEPHHRPPAVVHTHHETLLTGAPVQ